MHATTTHLRRFLREALPPGGGDGPDDVLRSLVRTAGVCGAVLRGPAPAGAATGAGRIVAAWFEPDRSGPEPPDIDALTVTALVDRAFALPSGPPAAAGGPVPVASLPVDDVDGGPGALTLYGRRALDEAAFDVAVEVLDLLPELCRIAVERSLITGALAVNRLLSEELGHKKPDDHRVYTAALDTLIRVMPGGLGGVVWRPNPPDGASRDLVAVHSTVGVVPSGGDGGDGGDGATVPSPAEAAFWSDEQVEHLDGDGAARWLVYTPLRAGRRRYGVLEVDGVGAAPPPHWPQICRMIGDQLALYLHLEHTRGKLQRARLDLGRTITSQAEALEDLEHQLVSPLLAATSRTEHLLYSRHVDSRVEPQLRAVRGLCRKSSRVAMSAGVFAMLSKGHSPSPRLDLVHVDDLLRLLIAGADDAQLLSNPRRRIEFTVDRASVRVLGRRFIEADRAFLEQCVGNLLDNATKYSFDNTRVGIGGRLDDGQFAVTVTNTGLALDPDDVSNCLQRNWRGANARSSTGEGSGLGLWIVDQLMRGMNGSVRVRPVDDTTTVMLRFPVR